MNLSYHQTNRLFKIIRMAENMIFTALGIHVELIVKEPSSIDKEPEDLMNVIASVLMLSPEVYQDRSKKQDHVYMRFITADLLKKYYSSMTLEEIGNMMGGRDHTTISYAIEQSENMLQQNNAKYCNMYSKSFKSVEEWLRDL